MCCNLFEGLTLFRGLKNWSMKLKILTMTKQLDEPLDLFKDSFISHFRRNASLCSPLFPLDLWNMLNTTDHELPCMLQQRKRLALQFSSLHLFLPSSMLVAFLIFCVVKRVSIPVSIIQYLASHQLLHQTQRYLDYNRRIPTIVDDFPNH